MLSTPVDRSRNALVVQHMDLVRKVAVRLARRLPSHVRIDELVSAGFLGLVEAADRFDTSAGKPFATFAEFRVRGAMLDELRRRDPMGRDARLGQKALEEAVRDLEHELGRPPSEEELAERLGLTLDRLRSRLEALPPLEVSLPSELMTPGDPELSTQRKQEKELLSRAIERLPKREQQILALYYQKGLTLRQIAEVFAITESRVSQILNQVHLQLRSRINFVAGGSHA